jgi:hypothetical protein
MGKAFFGITEGETNITQNKREQVTFVVVEEKI